MNKLLLFDIDGTLLTGSGAITREAFQLTFRSVHGIKVEDAYFETIHGFTDRTIFLDVLIQRGIIPPNADTKIDLCLSRLTESFINLFHACSIQMLPGIKEVLSRAFRENHVTGHVTGNTKGIASAKMKRLGIEHYFPFGGYGCHEHSDRSELVDYAISEAWFLDHFRESRNNVVLIGDTPRDVIAGKKAGVKTVAVATGKYSVEELRQSEPAIVIRNFKDDLDHFLTFIS